MASLTSTGYSGGAPNFVLPLMLLILVISGIVSIVKGLRTGTTLLTGLKALVGTGQALGARTSGAAQTLAGPVDLVGANMAAGILTNPALMQVSAIIGALQMCRQSGQVPAQYVTPRLAASWASGVRVMPSGFFSMVELHARPLTPTPVGARMLVWFTGRIVGGAPFTEYWSFITSAPLASFPVHCPTCGAPTAGSTSTGVCSYCHGLVLPNAPADGASQAAWLLDEIGTTPPAIAA